MLLVNKNVVLVFVSLAVIFNLFYNTPILRNPLADFLTLFTNKNGAEFFSK